MTDLIPARAVHDAAHEAWITKDDPRSIAVAALRAAVERLGFQDDYGTRLINVDDLLATINELETL